MIIETENPKGEIIYFDDSIHCYFNPLTKKVYQAVTKTVSNCFPKFNVDFVAKKVAAKRGIRPEILKKEWAVNRDQAAAFGTRVHKVAEARLIHKEMPEATTAKEKKYFWHLNSFITSLEKQKYEILATELIVFNTALNIAGTLDVVLLSPKGKYIIGDWKTNEEFKLSNMWQKGLGALAHLDDCHLNRYSLQDNLYNKILLEGNYFPTDNYEMMLYHVGKEGVTEYSVEHMDDEVQIILGGNLNATRTAF